MSKDIIKIQVRFTESTDMGEYSDCLYFIPSVYETMTQGDIDKLKKERVDNWLNIVKNPPVQLEPTQEQLEQERVALDEQIAQLTSRKVELTEKIVAMKPEDIKLG